MGGFYISTCVLILVSISIDGTWWPILNFLTRKRLWDFLHLCSQFYKWVTLYNKAIFHPKIYLLLVYVDKHWCSQRRVFLAATMLFLVLCLFYDIFYALQTNFFPDLTKWRLRRSSNSSSSKAPQFQWQIETATKID